MAKNTDTRVENDEGYGWVVITRRHRIAIGSESTPRLHWSRKRAIEFAKELEPHIGKCKVRPAHYHITVL